MAAAGAYRLAVLHDGMGWAWIGGAVVLLVADVVIDVWWARPSVLPSDQPMLNQRAAHYLGRRVMVSESIIDGRGRVRVGDTLWPATGPAVDAGSWVEVTGVGAGVLEVVPVPPASGSHKAPTPAV